MQRKFPNLFILGAPKCGTTSLARWLSEHPEVFFYTGSSNLKIEPHYWLGDIAHPKMTKKEYFSVFDKIGTQKYKYGGEASVWYLLFSASVIPKIERELEDPKYIVCIRNPVEMAYSLWFQYIKMGLELETEDFLKAFSLSEERGKGNLIKINPIAGKNYHPDIFNYKKVCSLGTQLEVLYRLLPQERLYVILLEDIKINPRREWIKLLNFLGVSDDRREDFPVYNEQLMLRSRFWYKVYLQLSDLFYLSYNLRKKLGWGRMGLLDKMRSFIFKKPSVKSGLNSVEYKYLFDVFIDEIVKLEHLLHRKLDIWKI